MLEKVIEMGMLFDFYGKLLTDRQQEVIYLYYYRDLSLGEIAEQLDISRQGVYDHIHRGEEVLKSYEQKLGLVSKYKRLKKELDGLSRYISDNKNINKTVKKDLLCRIDKISKEV
nr:YlxM family DNA-binding protein [Halothermothrix orenii]